MKSKIIKKRLIVIPVILILVIFLVFTDEGISVEKNESFGFDDDFNIEELSCLVFDEVTGDCLESGTLSITQPPDFQLSDSDNSGVVNFIELLLGSGEAVGLETHVSLFDIAGNTISSSSFTTIPSIKLDLSAGLGDDEISIDNVQIKFNVVIPEQTVTVDLKGKVAFYLDDTLIAKSKLFISDSVTSKVMPLTIDDKPSFDFTFIDENLSEDVNHSFRVVLLELEGKIRGNNKIIEIDYQAENIIYELTITSDRSLISIVDESGAVITILKSDSRLQVCGTSGETTILNHVRCSGGGAKSCSKRPVTNTAGKALPPTITIFDQIGNKIGTINDFPIPAKTTTCDVIEGLQRNSIYTINVGTQEFTVTTPTTQHNINIECKNDGGKITDSHKKICGRSCKTKDSHTVHTTVKQPFTPVCKSNFGYELLP